MPFGFEPHAHDAIEDECEEADHRVSSYSVRQAVVDGCNFDVGFQDTEPAFDVGKAFVAGDGFVRGEIGGVCQQRELAVEEFRLGNGVFIDEFIYSISHGGVRVHNVADLTTPVATATY